MGQLDFLQPQTLPFFAFQKNALLQQQNLKRNLAQKQSAYFQKPPEICKSLSSYVPLFWENKHAFAEDWRAQIEHYVASYGLTIEVLDHCDIMLVLDYLKQRYCEERAREISSFDLFRFMEYGHVLTLKDTSGLVKGTIFEVGYHTSEQTSYTIRLSVDESLEGKNLGYHMVIYSSLLAMEQGSRIKRGLLEFDNLQSMYINLNKVGWICDDFEPQIKGLGRFFKIGLPLTPAGLTSNAIDDGGLRHFILSKQYGIDYQLIETNDFDAVCELYDRTDFRICALVKEGLIDEQSYFFALPATSLKLLC